MNLEAIERHYARPDLGARLLRALGAVGVDTERLSARELAGFDQFHVGGLESTYRLARRVRLATRDRVLDVGGAIGGAARVLAAEAGCGVTVLDATAEFCRTGVMLTARAGLSDLVAFRHGSGLAMPFPDRSFDVVWMQHCAVNVHDKAGLFAEIRRVLAPGGRLAFHEVMAGPVAPIHLPVSWARDPSMSFLETADAVRRPLDALGFCEQVWIDESDRALVWFEQRLALAQAAVRRPLLGLHLLLGADARAMFGNMVANLIERRVAVVQAVLVRD